MINLYEFMFMTYIVRLWNHIRICSWNQPALSNSGKVSCPRKHQVPFSQSFSESGSRSGSS